MARRSTLVLATTVLGVLMFGGVALAATVTGTAGPDNLTGTAEADTINAYRGNDVIRAADGKADTIRCGRGFDAARVDTDLDVTVGCEDVAPGLSDRVANPQPAGAGGAGGGEGGLTLSPNGGTAIADALGGA